jgi:cytoskeletal protein RodZ
MSQPATPLRVPDHMSRADICAYLRELRLHFGLNETDVSERLHIRVKYITAIEQGQFEAMPGKAYARGYVHTYAEFLGLDAEQVVERCFGPELAREVQAHSVPESSRRMSGKAMRWPLIAAAIVLGFLGLAALHDTGGVAEEEEDSAQVEAVPESYLASLRNMVMPSSDSIDCFNERSWLSCFYAQRMTRTWVMPAVPEPEMIPAETMEKIERERAARAAAPAPSMAPAVRMSAPSPQAQAVDAELLETARKLQEQQREEAAAPAPAAQDGAQ